MTVSSLPSSETGRKGALARLCAEFQVDILYAFGSRSREALAWLQAQPAPQPAETGTQAAPAAMPADGRDLDIGVKPRVPLAVADKVRLALRLEDMFGVSRVDLICLPEADPFLAANIIRGERLYARDDYLADEYDLYILRRAGDLAPLERERQALIMEGRG